IWACFRPHIGLISLSGEKGSAQAIHCAGVTWHEASSRCLAGLKQADGWRGEQPDCLSLPSRWAGVTLDPISRVLLVPSF
uniref:Uncharacterized protein n=1 Tax=Pavo cristatus TaxID=9049 RepID=A0A8C9FVN4_PAVCR